MCRRGVDLSRALALGSWGRYFGPDGWLNWSRRHRVDRRRAQPRPHHHWRGLRLYLCHAGARPTPSVKAMPSRRGWLSLALGVLCLGAVAIPVSLSYGAAPPGANENAATLD